jgi:L-asparagine transporter-like permease
VIQIAGLALLCAVLVTMALDKETWRISWIVGVPWLALVSVAYFILKARGALAATAVAAAASAQKTGAH